jgi:hypothetical protein
MENLCGLRQLSSDYLREIETQLLQKKINEAEATTLCLIPFLLNKKESFPFQKLILFKDDSQQNLHYVTQFLKTYSWKGYSDRIRRALYQWSHGRYPLLRFKTIPTPFELLKVQATGKRVVTVFSQQEEWSKTYGDKNAFEFVLHDLVHAEHFFERKDWSEGQRQFYDFVLRNWNHPLTSMTRKQCPEQFDYLISDMNSHPKHLFQTFEALMLIAQKKVFGLELKDRLTDLQEKSFRKEAQYFFAGL